MLLDFVCVQNTVYGKELVRGAQDMFRGQRSGGIGTI